MTKLLSTWRGWLFAIFAAMFLTACDPIADIVVSPAPVVGANVSFKAELFEQFRDAPPANLQYRWHFGDGATAEGEFVTHVYTQAGTYEVILEATDDQTRSFGQAYVSKATVIVREPVSVAPFKVVLMSSDGLQPVGGARVTVGGQQGVTDALGVLTFPEVPTGVSLVVQVQADGYVPQSVVVGADGSRLALLKLKTASRATIVQDIAQPGAFQEHYLQARVSYGPGAFVRADGQPATGRATLAITPWDITQAADMDAFPGRRMARGPGGTTVRLISFGMINFHFEQDGQPLQLAPGQTAEISMHLPVATDEKGEPLVPGQKIPLWHFDEAAGLWVQEGEGEVYALDESGSALGVRARVSHFSSWNWDRVQDDSLTPLSAPVSCVVSEGDRWVGLPAGDYCDVTIQQTLANGMVLTDDLYVDPEGIVFDRFVPGARVEIQGLLGDLTRKGTLTVEVMTADAGRLDVQLATVVELVDMVGAIPVVTEAYVPFTVSGVGVGDRYEEIHFDEVRILKDGQPSSVQGSPHLLNDFVAHDGTSGTFTMVLVGQGNAAGSFGPGNLSGLVTVQVPVWRSELDVVTNQHRMMLNRTETVDVQMPVVTYSGLTLIRQAGGRDVFTFWSEVGQSLAIPQGASVTVQIKTYSALSVSNVSAPKSVTIAADGSFDLNLDDCMFIPGPRRAATSLIIEATLPGGEVKRFSTQPFLQEFPSCI